MQGIGGILFQPLTEPHDVIVNGARGSGVVLVAPDFVEQLFAGNHALEVFRHELQNLELLRRDRHSTDHCAITSIFVKLTVTSPKLKVSPGGGTTGAAHGRAHSSEQLTRC